MMAGCALDLPWMKDACSEEQVKIFEAGTPQYNAKEITTIILIKY